MLLWKDVQSDLCQFAEPQPGWKAIRCEYYNEQARGGSITDATLTLHWNPSSDRCGPEVAMVYDASLGETTRPHGVWRFRPTSIAPTPGCTARFDYRGDTRNRKWTSIWFDDYTCSSGHGEDYLYRPIFTEYLTDLVLTSEGWQDIGATQTVPFRTNDGEPTSSRPKVEASKEEPGAGNPNGGVAQGSSVIWL